MCSRNKKAKDYDMILNYYCNYFVLHIEVNYMVRAELRCEMSCSVGDHTLVFVSSAVCTNGQFGSEPNRPALSKTSPSDQS